MDTVTELMDRYIAIFNETNPARRRELIAQTWTEDGLFVDPLTRGEGHDGLDRMTQEIQAQFPGLTLRRISDVDSHNNRVRFAWELGPEGGKALAGGVDFGVLANGRLQTMTGFIDFAPQPAA